MVSLLVDDRSRNSHDCVIDQLSIRSTRTSSNTSIEVAAKNIFRTVDFEFVYDKEISRFDSLVIEVQKRDPEIELLTHNSTNYLTDYIDV
jgi:hypothetical protein